MALWVRAVQFQRSEDSKWEYGVAIGVDIGMETAEHIIDMQGNRLKHNYLWTYQSSPTFGSFIMGMTSKHGDGS